MGWRQNVCLLFDETKNIAKLQEEITLDDYTKIDGVLTEIEALQGEVTYEILKVTQIVHFRQALATFPLTLTLHPGN